MPLETLPFDLADYVTTPEEQLALLQDALEEGDPGLIANAIGVIARARSMSGVAHASGLSRAAIYKSLAPGGDPRLSTVMGVLKVLGIGLQAVPAVKVADETAEEAA